MSNPPTRDGAPRGAQPGAHNPTDRERTALFKELEAHPVGRPQQETKNQVLSRGQKRGQDASWQTTSFDPPQSRATNKLSHQTESNAFPAGINGGAVLTQTSFKRLRAEFPKAHEQQTVSRSMAGTKLGDFRDGVDSPRAEPTAATRQQVTWREIGPETKLLDVFRAMDARVEASAQKKADTELPRKGLDRLSDAAATTKQSARAETEALREEINQMRAEAASTAQKSSASQKLARAEREALRKDVVRLRAEQAAILQQLESQKSTQAELHALREEVTRLDADRVAIRTELSSQKSTQSEAAHQHIDLTRTSDLQFLQIGTLHRHLDQLRAEAATATKEQLLPLEAAFKALEGDVARIRANGISAASKMLAETNWFWGEIGRTRLEVQQRDAAHPSPFQQPREELGQGGSSVQELEEQQRDKE